MSTSRLDEGLNLLSDSLDTLASNIQQLTLQVHSSTRDYSVNIHTLRFY